MFRIPKIDVPQLNMDELRQSLQRYAANDPFPALRERIARLDAARQSAAQDDDD